MMRVLGILLSLLLAGCSGGLQIDHSHPSLGQDSRVQFVVIHYTGGDFDSSLQTLVGRDVSTHYLISEGPDAQIYQLVDEGRRAWHAGDSEWQGRTWLNATSIGIELVNRGYTGEGSGRRWYAFSDAQIDQLILLLKDIASRHQIKPAAIVGHGDIAPGRKVDPGPLFPWYRLAKAGLIPWPSAARVSTLYRQFVRNPPEVAWFQRELARFGYRVPESGILDAETRQVLTAFQMRYRPRDYDGQPDAETAALLAAVNEQI